MRGQEQRNSSMSQTQKKNWLTAMSPTTRTLSGILIIAVILVIGIIYGPHYADSNTTTGDAPVQTITVTGLLSSLQVNRSLIHQGVTLTVTSVEQAHTFSDDNKSSYAHVKYILRVHLHVVAP